MFSTSLYKDIRSDQWPIVYSREYDITFGGFERIHPFDSGKWGKIVRFLQDEGMLTNTNFVEPEPATSDDLRVVHPQSYLDDLRWSARVAAITEVCFLSCVPNFIVQRKILQPFRYQTGGTVLAARLALDRGWAINVGGGFHHCSGADGGGGFCVYADITLAIKYLFGHFPQRVKKVMIIDLDAHQGNGHERDFIKDNSVFIFDVFNAYIYPFDQKAKGGISSRVELRSYTGDEDYLAKVGHHLRESLATFSPDFVLYNAGTDILEGDSLGCLSITPAGVVARDELVFREVGARPICMVTSGGYLRQSARVIADSILNLRTKGFLSPPEGTTS